MALYDAQVAENDLESKVSVTVTGSPGEEVCLLAAVLGVVEQACVVFQPDNLTQLVTFSIKSK